MPKCVFPENGDDSSGALGDLQSSGKQQIAAVLGNDAILHSPQALHHRSPRPAKAFLTQKCVFPERGCDSAAAFFLSLGHILPRLALRFPMLFCSCACVGFTQGFSMFWALLGAKMTLYEASKQAFSSAGFALGHRLALRFPMFFCSCACVDFTQGFSVFWALLGAKMTLYEATSKQASLFLCRFCAWA